MNILSGVCQSMWRITNDPPPFNPTAVYGGMENETVKCKYKQRRAVPKRYDNLSEEIKDMMEENGRAEFQIVLGCIFVVVVTVGIGELLRWIMGWPLTFN